jgi:hypothetical protein
MKLVEVLEMKYNQLVVMEKSAQIRFGRLRERELDCFMS